MTDIELIADVLCLNVRMILESGGETYRAEDTALRMGEGFGLNTVEVIAFPTGVMMTVTGREESVSRIVRVKRRETDLKRLDACNAVSRQAAEGKLTPAEAMNVLKEIQQSASQRHFVLILACALSAAFFSVMFGGRMPEVTAAFTVGAVSEAITFMLNRRHVPGMLSGMQLGFVITLFTLLITLILPELGIEAVISGCLMPLLPGLAMTAAVRDTMRGDLVSGGARVTEAFMSAFMLAAGAGIMLSMWKYPVNTLSSVPGKAALLCGCFGAGFMFSLMLNQPLRLLWTGPVFSVIGYALFDLLGQTTVAYFAASLLICVICETAARLIKCTATILITVSVIPMVPGVGLYRTMLYLTRGEYRAAADMGAETLLGILSIALAITATSLLFVQISNHERFLKRRKRRKKYAHTDHK